jgi:hypothetical protein
VWLGCRGDGAPHDQSVAASLKVEKWTKNGDRIERMLYAGSDLDKARDIFAAAIKHRPRIRLTIRQRARVLKQWPEN